jgi:hypothetical protein
VNLELPFAQDDAAFDAYLAEIDRALDALFLDEVGSELERLQAERAAAGADEVAA